MVYQKTVKNKQYAQPNQEKPNEEKAKQEQSKQEQSKQQKPKKWIKPKQHLGVSQLASALGLSKWLTSIELKNRLEKGYFWEANNSTKFGHQKEKLAKYYYTKLTKRPIKRAKFICDPNCRQLVGIADGLVGEDGGIEIKCHYSYKTPLKYIPIYYLVQVAGYMHLYDKKWWDFMSVCFDCNDISKCHIIRVYREDLYDAWYFEWYPMILDYIEKIKWVPKEKTQAIKQKQ